MFAILLTAFLAADVEPKPAAMAGQAPRIINAAVKGDRLVSKQTVYQVMPVTETRTVKVNGQEQTQTVTVYKTVIRELEYAWDLKKGKATTAGGKNISLDDLKKRLGKAGPIVLSVDGKAVGAGYLKLFAPDTIVIVAPLIAPKPTGAAPKVDPNPVPLPKPAPRPNK